MKKPNFLKFSHERLFSADKSFKRVSLIMMTRLSIPLQYEVGYVFKINLNLLAKASASCVHYQTNDFI